MYEVKQVPKSTHIIGVKWVLREKKAISLTPAKLKVAKRFSQIKGINYEETYAPVSHTAAIRLLFAVSMCC